MPLYVRAGAVLPLGPVKQYVEQQVDEPTSLMIYPGANGSASLYEDDGHTFAYRHGAWMRMDMAWQDQTRTLTLRLAPGARMLPPAPRRFTVRLAGSTDARSVTFSGQPVTVRLS